MFQNVLAHECMNGINFVGETGARLFPGTCNSKDELQGHTSQWRHLVFAISVIPI